MIVNVGIVFSVWVKCGEVVLTFCCEAVGGRQVAVSVCAAVLLLSLCISEAPHC